MTEKTVSNLTVDELKTLVAEVVDARLRLWLMPVKPVDRQRLKKSFETIDRLMIKPKPGTPTGSEMIIAERERWRKGM